MEVNARAVCFHIVSFRIIIILRRRLIEIL